MNLRISSALALAMATCTVHAAYTLDPSQSVAAGANVGAVAIGDVTGDGRDDVVVAAPAAGEASSILVFAQTPAGTLAAPVSFVYGTAGQGSTGLALSDLNRDGRLDIIVGDATGISVLARNGSAPLGFSTRHFSGEPVAGTGWAAGADIAVMDVNRDGWPDVVVQSDWKDVVVYFSDGRRGGIRFMAGVVTRMSGDGYNDLALGDFNGDGLSDMAITSPYDPLRIYYNNGKADFTTPPVTLAAAGASWGLAVGDFNHDGRQDLVATRERTVDSPPPYWVDMYLQTTGSTLASPVAVPTAAPAWPGLAADLDGDGRDDLVLVHGGEIATGLSFFLQGPDGLGAEQWLTQPSGGLDDSHDVAVGDINADGCKDVVTTNYLGRELLLYDGHGCQALPDMSVGIAGSRSSVTVALANTPGTGSIASPRVRLDLSVGSGSMQAGLPSGCSIQRQTVLSQRIDCAVDTLAPGATTSLAFPLTLSGSGPRASLTASAHAGSDTVERSVRNNTASLRVSP